MPLLDAEHYDQYRHELVLAYPPAEWAARRHWTAYQRLDPLRVRAEDETGGPVSFAAHAGRLRLKMALALDVRPALTVVNDGRWVVHCPDPGCSEAQVAARTDRRFFCTFCLNREAGGHWRQAWWPDQAEEDEVERILAGRLDVKRRQWWPSDGQGAPRPEVAWQLAQLQRHPAGLLQAEGV